MKQQEEQVEYEKKMAVYRANLPAAGMIATHVANGGGQMMEEEEDEEDEEYSDEEA